VALAEIATNTHTRTHTHKHIASAVNRSENK